MTEKFCDEKSTSWYVVNRQFITLFCLAVYSDFDDLFDVQKELYPVSTKWRSIGIALRLKPNTLELIQAENSGDPSACLASVVMEWLRRNYNVERFGEPTWQQLVEAVDHPAGGANMALARNIARRHKAGGMSNRYICCTVGKCCIFVIKCKHTPPFLGSCFLSFELEVGENLVYFLT